MVGYNSAFAQDCDSLNKRLFNTLLSCDSAITVLRDENLMLHGEIQSKNVAIDALNHLNNFQGQMQDEHEKYKDFQIAELKSEKKLHEELFIGWIILSTVLFFIIK